MGQDETRGPDNKQGRGNGGGDKRVARRKTLIFVGVFVVAAAALVVGLILNARTPGVDDRAGGLNALCPNAKGNPIVMIDWASRHYSPSRGSSYTKTWFFFAVYDPATGERRLRTRLTTTSSKQSQRIPDCIGAQGKLVWVWTAGDKLHARAIATGKTVIDNAALVGALGGEVHRFGFDETRGQLAMLRRDGRAFAVTDVAGNKPTLSPIDRFPGSVRRPTGTVGVSRVSVQPTRTLPDGRRLRSERNGHRSVLYLGDKRLGDDWLSPQLLRRPLDRSVVWPDPPSLLVVTPTKMQSKRYTISRVSLKDGKVLWQYRPPKDGLNVSQDGSWHATSGAETLIYFMLGAQMVGVDPATGKQTFLVHM